MNSRLKTAFSLSIVAIAMFFFLLFLAMLGRLGLSYLLANQITRYATIFCFVVGPLVLAIVALSLVRTVRPTPEERKYKIMTMVFSFVTIGSIFTYLSAVLAVLLIFGALLL